MQRPLITVVDDDSSVRKSLARLLKAAGFEAMTFASARDFLEGGGLAPAPECLILDIRLGGMNGFELYEHLMATACNVPVIFITAYDDAPTRERARQTGSAGYLHKPFEQHALLGAIYRALKQENDSMTA
jgi:two-component system, LuxR family, response regulator FixJ